VSGKVKPAELQNICELQQVHPKSSFLSTDEILQQHLSFAIPAQAGHEYPQSLLVEISDNATPSERGVGKAMEKNKRLSMRIPIF
jgi:hypothetical protein